MDERMQVIELLRDRFDKLDTELNDLHTTLKDHTKIDERYWGKIDQQEAQLSLVKWVSSGVSGSALIAWLYAKFGGH